MFGPAVSKLNKAIIDAARERRPNFALFWRPTHVFPSTVEHLERLGIRTVSYNNDDPFGTYAHANVPLYHHLLWHHYLNCLPYFEKNFFYRKVNCQDAVQAGAKHAQVLLPYFLPWRDRPISVEEVDRKKYGADFVFVGHFEPDGRAEAIRALIRAGHQVRLWGDDGWRGKLRGPEFSALPPVRPVRGDDYAMALAGASVCLCFLSRLNRDTYTRRCFEIPACGRVMLSERTEDLRHFFEEDVEACYFSSHDELLAKAGYLLRNERFRESVACAARARVLRDGHDVVSRAGWFIRQLLCD